MTRAHRIGGQLNYEVLSQRHRPACPHMLAAEIHRLHSEQHLSAQDISSALRLAYDQVITVLSSNEVSTP